MYVLHTGVEGRTLLRAYRCNVATLELSHAIAAGESAGMRSVKVHPKSRRRSGRCRGVGLRGVDP